ncbi:hypothetical protein Prubr_47680 [Polymorphospora rubra]|uniref:Uncharacterized protein n=1 Tax=Polymorphospora rubra TaxID=338584 RepID=A0A810N325_9ACTN|nr:hypothetical protein Prubr_47680 [Polymorphospora rubra]
MTVKVYSNRCACGFSATSRTRNDVYGSPPSCTVARTVAPGSADASNDSAYVSPAISGTSFCPIPPSHGFARPPGASAHSRPSTIPLDVVPYVNQPAVPLLKSPFSICSGGSSWAVPGGSAGCGSAGRAPAGRRPW